MTKSDTNPIKSAFILSGALFVVFILFTVAVKYVDVQAIGPEDSAVGLASINSFARDFAGSSEIWDFVSDVLGYAAFIYILGFACLGFYQLVSRKSFFKVDLDIYALAWFYVIVFGFYELFEHIIINYRPVLEDGVLEASYPSSHTMLAICIYATASLQFRYRLGDGAISNSIKIITEVAMLFCVITRFFSGMHWLTDIVGAVLLSLALTKAYEGVFELIKSKKENK